MGEILLGNMGCDDLARTTPFCEAVKNNKLVVVVFKGLVELSLSII